MPQPTKRFHWTPLPAFALLVTGLSGFLELRGFELELRAHADKLSVREPLVLEVVFRNYQPELSTPFSPKYSPVAPQNFEFWYRYTARSLPAVADLNQLSDAEQRRALHILAKDRGVHPKHVRDQLARGTLTRTYQDLLARPPRDKVQSGAIGVAGRPSWSPVNTTNPELAKFGKVVLFNSIADDFFLNFPGEYEIWALIREPPDKVVWSNSVVLDVQDANCGGGDVYCKQELETGTDLGLQSSLQDRNLTRREATLRYGSQGTYWNAASAVNAYVYAVRLYGWIEYGTDRESRFADWSLSSAALQHCARPAPSELQVLHQPSCGLIHWAHRWYSPEKLMSKGAIEGLASVMESDRFSVFLDFVVRASKEIEEELEEKSGTGKSRTSPRLARLACPRLARRMRFIRQWPSLSTTWGRRAKISNS